MYEVAFLVVSGTLAANFLATLVKKLLNEDRQFCW